MFFYSSTLKTQTNSDLSGEKIDFLTSENEPAAARPGVVCLRVKQQQSHAMQKHFANIFHYI